MSITKKKIIVLGSTGSIGTNTLDVVRRFPESFQIVGLSCRNSLQKIQGQVLEFHPQAVALTAESTGRADILNEIRGPSVKVYRGEDCLAEMIAEVEADLVVNGISGSKGLPPTLQCLEAGVDLALANKESMVMAGALIMETAERSGARLVPVDSEHFGLFSLLHKISPQEVDQLILTASGGAFRDLPLEKWRDIRLRDALDHPNWLMGPKNTIDSATMANKGLEFIEARHFFQFEPDQIKVLIHPQSYVHALVRTIDGFLYAQISKPDMRLVIQAAISFPDMHLSPFAPLDLQDTELGFYAPDLEKYRMLQLAYRAVELGGAFPIVYNAANEVAVDLFMKEKILFMEIPWLVEKTLEGSWSQGWQTVEEILVIDDLARRKAIDEAMRYKKVVS